MFTQTRKILVGTSPVSVYSRAVNQVQSVIIYAAGDVEVSVGHPCAYGDGLPVPTGGAYAIGREDLPDSADLLEIYAVSLSNTSVRVVEVVR